MVNGGEQTKQKDTQEQALSNKLISSKTPPTIIKYVRQ